jgi:hypothetical protein
MRWIAGFVVVAGLVALLIAVRSNPSDEPAAPEVATVKPIKGTDLNQVQLSPIAAKRLGIKTAPVTGGRRAAIPYAAVLYDASGKTYTYTSPKPLVFVRHPIDVTRVVGSKALLRSGPPSGTAVVTVGSQELYGTEFEVEED